MQTIATRSFREEFARSAAWRRERQERQLVENIRHREEEDRKRGDHRGGLDDELMDFAAAVMASDAQIAEFRGELDIYQAATVDALLENERQLNAVDKELGKLLAQAYVLPDGRRVFKTEDGTQVFDEFGKEVRATVIDPDLIEDWRPHWQIYENPFRHKADLIVERAELHEYQDLTDEMDAEVDSGHLTKARKAELQKLLEENAPDAIKRRVDPEHSAATERAEHDEAPSNVEPGMQQAIAGFTAKLDMPEFGR